MVESDGIRTNAGGHADLDALSAESDAGGMGTVPMASVTLRGPRAPSLLGGHPRPLFSLYCIHVLPHHYTPATLARLFDGPGRTRPKRRAQIDHLARCPSCRTVAAGLPRRRGKVEVGLGRRRAPRSWAFVEEETRSAVEALEAQGGGRSSGSSAPRERRRVRRWRPLRSLPGVEDAPETEAATVGRSDPFLGESMAGMALAVADHLPSRDFRKAL